MYGLCINKTGRALPVYKYNFLGIAVEADGSPCQPIGYIQPNEVFIRTGTWDNGWQICDNGTIDSVMFHEGTNNLVGGWIENSYTDAEAASILNYPLGHVTVNGTQYSMFKLIETTPVYNAAGVQTGIARAGSRILTNDSTRGQTMPYLMRCMYYENGSNSNVWKPCSGVEGEYGFIDTGIRWSDGTRNSIAIRATW